MALPQKKLVRHTESTIAELQLQGLNRRGLIREGVYLKFNIKDTINWLDTLKKELDKKVLTLKHMKLEIGNIKMIYTTSTH